MAKSTFQKILKSVKEDRPIVAPSVGRPSKDIPAVREFIEQSTLFGAKTSGRLLANRLTTRRTPDEPPPGEARQVDLPFQVIAPGNQEDVALGENAFVPQENADGGVKSDACRRFELPPALQAVQERMHARELQLEQL
jgi:hypothetical protein